MKLKNVVGMMAKETCIKLFIDNEDHTGVTPEDTTFAREAKKKFKEFWNSEVVKITPLEKELWLEVDPYYIKKKAKGGRRR